MEVIKPWVGKYARPISWGETCTSFSYVQTALLLCDAATDRYFLDKANPFCLGSLGNQWVVRSRQLRFTTSCNWFERYDYDAVLTVWTRLRKIGNSSFGVEQCVKHDKFTLVECNSTLVLVSDNHAEAREIPEKEKLRGLLDSYEKVSLCEDSAIPKELTLMCFSRDFPRIESNTPVFVHTLVPRASDMDKFDHVNNTCYALYIHDVRVAGRRSGIPRACSFDYQAPLFAGVAYTVFLYEWQGLECFLIRDDNEKTCFRAKYLICSPASGADFRAFV
mmetsp:Transcript_9962/g.16308  ORF Transcript_9962/g.16308 Transcript_9962/m.16308 type:complete len:277 (-) Transcript_9962:539-1369(-)